MIPVVVMYALYQGGLTLWGELQQRLKEGAIPASKSHLFLPGISHCPPDTLRSAGDVE